MLAAAETPVEEAVQVTVIAEQGDRQPCGCPRDAVCCVTSAAPTVTLGLHC